MKKILLLIIILFPICTYGQNCKYEENEIDEFTGVRTVKTYTGVLTPIKEAKKNQYMVFFCCRRYDEDCFVQIGLMTKSSLNIMKDQELFFKLQNDSIIKIKSPETNLNSEFVDEGYFKINNQYPISREDLIRLRDVGVKKVRIVTHKGYIDSSVSEIGMKHIKQFINCLFDTL